MKRMASKYLIGLDIGTSGAKCILVDDKGAVLASSTQEYPLCHVVVQIYAGGYPETSFIRSYSADMRPYSDNQVEILDRRSEHVSCENRKRCGAVARSRGTQS